MARTVVVTGASKGIGRAIALRLLKEGFTILGIARDFSRFPSKHRRFHRVSLDLSDLGRVKL